MTQTMTWTENEIMKNKLMTECKAKCFRKKKNSNQSGQKISNSVNIHIKFTIFFFHFVAKQDCPKRKKKLKFNTNSFNSQRYSMVCMYRSVEVWHKQTLSSIFFPFSTNLNVEEKLYKDNEQFTYVFNMIFLDQHFNINFFPLSEYTQII